VEWQVMASGAGRVCPRVPGDAQQYTDEILGYVLWGVGVIFVFGLVVSIGAVVAGRLLGMPHASRVGVIGGVVVFVAAIAYLVVPGLLDEMLGAGCI
jgi:hypothetical protein